MTLNFLIKKLALMYKFRYNLARAKIVDTCFNFLKYTKVEGDYFEFGVFSGGNFEYAFRSSRLKGFSSMKFFAFDSFQGFSTPLVNENLNIVHEGGRSCSLENFMKNLRKGGVDLNFVRTVKGWFKDTLEGTSVQKTMEVIGSSKVAFAYIDCDLFEPTLSVLNFITPLLVDGSVLVFDNWFLFRGHPDRGERKAFELWKKANPHLNITQFHKFGWHGESFIVNTKLQQ